MNPLILFSLLVALIAAGPSAAAAQEWPFRLGQWSVGQWDVSVSSVPQVADPSWTAVVYARRAGPTETASLSGAAMPARKPSLTGPHALDGLASFYGRGVITASGEAFDRTAMTAAHKTLPMGTRVKVTNLENGHSVVLRINDRGPFVAGRVIDVSEGAADILGMRHAGVAKVKVEPVSN